MYNRKRIARGTGTAISVWALIGLFVVSSGFAYALPLAGIGGFTITADQVAADEVYLYPGTGDTSEFDAYPQAVVELEGTSLQDLTLTKVIDLGSSPALSGNLKLAIASQGETTGSDMVLKSSTLQSGGAVFTNFTAADTNSSTLENTFQIEAADGVTLQRQADQPVEIRAHYLATNSISLSNLRLAVCYDPDDDGTYENGPCDSESRPSGTSDGNQRPTAGVSASVTSANPGDEITFDGSMSVDNDGVIDTYQWDFDDGSTAGGQTVTHTFSSAGTYDVTVTVTDDGGATDSTSVTVTVDNDGPTANASVEPPGTPAVTTDTILFSGRGSNDPDAPTESLPAGATYEWAFGDGTTTSGTIGGNNYTADATYSYDSAGNYTATLTVTDGNGASDTDTVSIEVEANDPPTVSASANTTAIDPGETVTFDGGASSDPDGTVSSYTWDFDDGTNGTGETVAHTFSSVGTYTVTLTATDDDRATATDTVTISAQPNQSPTADATASQTMAVTTDTITFDGSGSSDSDGSVSSYEWDFGDGTTATGATADHSYASGGNYTATLTVIDDDGATGTDTVDVTIGNNSAPSASASANTTSIDPGETVEFDGSSSTDDGSISSYEWNFDDGSTGTGDVVNHTYSSSGDYNATLTVTDDDGATDADTVTITVNEAPTASASANTTNVSTNETVSFDGSGSSDSDGTITSYEWDFGDGSTGAGETTTYPFSSTGIYTVTVTVTDDDGTTATDTVTIEVN